MALTKHDKGPDAEIRNMRIAIEHGFSQRGGEKGWVSEWNMHQNIKLPISIHISFWSVYVWRSSC